MSNNFVEDQQETIAKEIKVKPLEYFIGKQKTQNNSASTDNNVSLINLEIEETKQQLETLKEQKQALIEETTTVIEKEKKDWEVEKQKYIDQAKKEGYEAGFTSGREESMKAFEAKVLEANTITETAKMDYLAVVEQSKQTIVDLAIRTSEKIITKKINEDSTVFLSIVQRVLEEIKDQQTVEVYLHPDNYPHVIKEKDTLTEVLDGDTIIEIYIDQSLEKDDCLIKHSFGEIDASVHTQLGQIHKVLYDISMEGID